MPESITEIERLGLSLAEHRAALATSEARNAALQFELEKQKIARVYAFKDGDSVSITTGVITRKAAP